MVAISFSVCQALVVRCILTCHVILCTWRVAADLKSPMYWLLICGLFPLLCESCYTIVRRQGVEFSRFTPCFLFYLGAVLPGIWLLELDKTDNYIEGKLSQLSQADNNTEKHTLLVISLSPTTWIIVIEEMLPYVLFLGRWILPRGKVRREELAELLFAFIEIAADIMEFFSLFDEDVIRSNKTLAYCILAIWSLAVLQFTMTVTVIHQPKKEKNFINGDVDLSKEKESSRLLHECFAIILTILMQDLPFAVMRLYTIINFNYINYSLIFFTSKNLIIISLLLYKVAALCKARYCPEIEKAHYKSGKRSNVGERGRPHSGERNISCSFGGMLQACIDVDNSWCAQKTCCTCKSVYEGTETGTRHMCFNCNFKKGRIKSRYTNKDRYESETFRMGDNLSQKMKQNKEVCSDLCEVELACACEGEAQENSSHLAESPSHLAQAPSHLAQAPSHLVQAPSHLAQSPSHLAQAPSHLAQAPSHLAQAPSHLAQAPSHLAQAPSIPSYQSTSLVLEIDLDTRFELSGQVENKAGQTTESISNMHNSKFELNLTGVDSDSSVLSALNPSGSLTNLLIGITRNYQRQDSS